MSKTVLCVLLKVLMLARTDILDPDSDFMQDNPVSESDYDILQNLKFDRNHLDSVNVRNKTEIPFANTSVISESIESKLVLSKPTSPRAFVELHNGFLNKEDNISAIFRWNQPEFANEIIQGYTVQCWFIENLKEIQICDDKNISAKILEHTVYNLKPNTTYYFQVRAHTKVGAGPYTDLINVSTTHENPIPQLLMVTRNGIDLWDMDSKINVNLVKDKKQVIDVTYSIAEHKIFWSNEGRELMMLEINENNITKIAQLQNIARHLCIDWVARNLYWIERNTFHLVDIIKFDLTRWQNGIVKYNKILKISTYGDTGGLTLLPSTGLLYWTNYTNRYRDPLPVQSDLNGKNAQIFHKDLSVCIPFVLNMFSFHHIKISNLNTKEPLIYWLFDKFLLVTDFNVSICNLILNVEKIGKLFFKSLDIDKTNIYIDIKYDNNIYVLKKKYALLETVDAFKYIQKVESSSPINKIHAFGESLQSYPPTRCLTPDKKVYNVGELTYMVTTNSIIVNIPELIPKSGCKKYNLPTTLYTINIISYCVDNKLNKFDNFTVQTYERYYEVQNLTSLTEYKLLLIISNFYSNQLSMDPLIGSEVILRTKPSKLDVPKNVTVEALTPTVAAVYWMPSKKLNCVPVIYKVCWMLIINNTGQINNLLNNTEECTVDSKFFTIIEPLIPEQQYKVYVHVYSANFSDHYNDSSSEILYMYPEPNNITLNYVSTDSMNISWIPSVNLTIYYWLEYKNVETQEWQIARNFELHNREEVIYYIKNLLPETLYEFRLILRYPKYKKDYIWPSHERIIFSTLNDIPKTPGIIILEFFLPFSLSLVGVVTTIYCIYAIIICVCYFYRLYRQRNKNNKQVLPPTEMNELEILPEMPNSNVQFNTLYSPVLQHNSNENVLTEIKREDISVGKLLGRGAFGEVFRGKVQNLGNLDIEISVAIKRLKKNASLQEKEKFLEEAKLMNNFRHKHVLRLLGVCLDQDSPLIVLELMEVDLLQYLRDSRKLQSSDSDNLRLQDLLAMCEDVARGCCYLENLRFVHRDLACRNCLVSERDRENRVIKIGDFGLSKHIYKNDYYRVKGQALLPVCWMAPESLVVGIFTCQSDVWSFGVLMWEITSLGESPYTGKINEQVIDFVRAGGRLSMPLNCPPTLYKLMLRCWSPKADNRPNFNDCLENIIALRNNINDTLLNLVDII